MGFEGFVKISPANHVQRGAGSEEVGKDLVRVVHVLYLFFTREVKRIILYIILYIS